MANNYCLAHANLPKGIRCSSWPINGSPALPLSYRLPHRPPVNMDRMPKICEGIVFVMLLGLTSHLYSVRGTMEKLYGYDRIQTTKRTNHMLEYLFDQWAFLSDLNEEHLSNKMVEYCTFLGTKANPVDPSACESYLYIDGVNVLP